MVASSRPSPNLKNSLKYYDECPLTSDLVPRVSYYRPVTYPYPATPIHDETAPSTMLPAGTFLHKGFYDLLAMIPTPSSSRFLWGAGGSNQAPPTDGEIISASPCHEDINPKPRHMPGSSPLKKGRRVSKAMVSRPTGFV
jgi:hypothetical protein